MTDKQNDINTFANCEFRVEEILHNKAYYDVGLEWVSTDPGLLDWSACEIPGKPKMSCQCNLENGVCPNGFANPFSDYSVVR